MKRLFLFVFLYSFLAYAEGGHVGNGGNALQCHPSPANHLDGIYSLDYVLTLDSATGDDGLSPVADWSSSAVRLQRLLEEKVPGLAPSFADFVRQLYNRDYGQNSVWSPQTRVWEPAPFGLVKLDDQELVSLLPENCSENGTFKIIQAVVRQRPGSSGAPDSTVVYRYFPQVLDQLNRQSPLQLSFVLVHEWLWDVSRNVDRNRRVNRFLHSRDFEQMSASQANAVLRGMGLVVPPRPAKAFDRSSWPEQPLVTPEQLREKFGQLRSAYYPLEIAVLGFDRDYNKISCSEEHPECEPGWRGPLPEDDVLTTRKIGLFYAGGDKEYPIQLGGKGSDGLMYIQTECRFLPGKDSNLECRRFVDTSSSKSYRESLPPGELPTTPAAMTISSFRMITGFSDKFRFWSSNGKQLEGNQLVETATTGWFP